MRARDNRNKVLVGVEFFTSSAALVGGLLLVAEPDGALLRAKMSALAGSPFSDWRLPGVLLALLVGGGFLLSGEWQRRGLPHARGLSLLAGVGLIAFEATELVWIGFQPLEAIFALVGVAVVFLSIRSDIPSRTVPLRGALRSRRRTPSGSCEANHVVRG